MYFHYQNLKKEDRNKNVLLHGRCWLNHGDLHAEWMVPSGRFAIMLYLNAYSDTAIGLKVSLWLFSIYISTQNRRLYEWLEPKTKRCDVIFSSGRSIGVSFFDNTIWVDLWRDMNDWRSSDPWWWQFNINLADLILGKAKYHKSVLKQGGAEIDMPEGIYPANFEITRSTWTRPRWFKQIRESIEFELPVGIPKQGKGENSWDIGMTATTGISVEWEGNIHQATKKIAMMLLAERQRFGRLGDSAYARWRTKGIKKQIKSLEQLSNSK